MSRKNNKRRAADKARKAKRSEAMQANGLTLQTGKVRSVVSSYSKFSSLSSAPSISFAPSRIKLGADKTKSQAHKPAQELIVQRSYPAEHGRSNLIGKPSAPDGFKPDRRVGSSKPLKDD